MRKPIADAGQTQWAVRRVTRLLAWVTISSALLSGLSWLSAYLRWTRFHDEGGGMWAHWNDKFADVEHFDRLFPCLHQACFFTQGEPFTYPAPLVVVYDVLLHLGPMRLGAVILLLSVAVSVGAVAQARGLVRFGLSRRVAAAFTTAEVFLSWPLLFLIERANLEVVVFVVTLAGAVFWMRGRPRLAAVFWGCAAGMKLYPVLLLATFLERRRLGALLVGLAVAGLTVVASAAFVGPNFVSALRGSVAGVSGFIDIYGGHVRLNELRFDHSLLALLKTGLLIDHAGAVAFARVDRFYLPALAIVGGSVLLLRFPRTGQMNRFLLATCAMLLLPPVSYDYTLVHLYPAFALIIFTALCQQERSGRAGLPLFAGMTVLLSPEQFLSVRAVQLDGAVKALALLMMIGYLLFVNLPECGRLVGVADGDLTK